VAEELNFRRAAANLGIAQPALSQQVRQLEDEMEVRLLDRNRRHVSLTEAGKAFLTKAKTTLASAAEAVRAAQEAHRGEIGHLSIGFVTSALYGIFPDIVRVFRQKFPHVRIELFEMAVSGQAELLRSGRIDVSFLRPPLIEKGLVMRTILQESWVAALPSSHAAARHSIVALKSLAKDPFILFPRNLAPNLYDGILAMCQRAGFSPHVVIEAQLQATVSLVAAGMGVALVPESLRNLRRKGVVYKQLQEPAPKVALALAWRDEEMTPVLRSFLSLALRDL
jgi:DNA-binding transcriptional LysR family regulator